MTRRELGDPYGAVIRALNRRGVRYVVVGMSGINYYAKKPAETFATLDYDIFLQPTLENVRRATEGLEKLGFSLATSVGRFERKHLTGVVRDRRTLIATTTMGIAIELLLAISGFPFSEVARDAETFTVHGVPVQVGRLTKLSKSKQLAGRPKDRAFLKRYQALLEEEP